MKEKSLGQTLFFIILFLPVFLGYELGRGFVTDATPFNIINSPVLPVGAFFLIGISPFFLGQKAIANIVGINLFFGILAIIIYQTMGFYRQFAFNVAILLGCIAYYIGLYFSRRNPHKKILKNLTWAVLAIILSKLATDILIFGSFYSDSFLIGNIKIYNAYDYFPLVYLISGALAILVIKEHLTLGILTFASSFISFFSYSRFYACSVVLLYMLVFFKVYKIKTTQLLVATLIFVMISTFGLAYFYSYFSSDASLSLRFGHWANFFKATEVHGLLIPLLNDYREELSWGGFHNEFLDFYSYFGILFFWVASIYISLVCNVDIRTRIALLPFYVLLVVGMLVQNNITTPYGAMIIFFLLGLFQSRTEKRGVKATWGQKDDIRLKNLR